MTQFANLSTEVQNIVSNFFNASRKTNFFTEAHKQLMVSLYSETPEADAKVLDVLSEYVISLADHFTPDEIKRLKKEYSAVVGYCFKYCDTGNGGMVRQSTGVRYLPESIVELCSSIASPVEGKSILLPFSGDGSFAPLCSGASLVEGFELSEESWALSQIVLKSVNKKANIALSDGMCLRDSKQKYDFVFAFPPMVPGRNNLIVDIVYDTIVNHLNEEGELYAVLPYNFCSDTSGWFAVRKILLERKEFSAMVIALPPMLSPASSVKLCLVHFAKNNKNIVALADVTGEEFFARQDIAGSKEFTLKVSSVLETIQKQDEKYFWVGKADVATAMNMQPSRYLVSQNLPRTNAGEKYVKLGDVIEIIPLTRDENLQNKARRRNNAVHQNSNELFSDEERLRILNEFKEIEKTHILPLVGMKELSSNYLNCVIGRSDIPLGKKVEYTYLTQDCLLVGYMGGKFKVGKTEGITIETPITLRSEILPFKVISNDVTEEYVLHCLAEAYVEKQAACYETGVTITRLRKEDFLSILIKVPSLEEQDKICKADTRTSLTESDRKIIESYEDFRKDMHMKKHAIGQTIFNLNNWWKVLLKARKEGNGILDDSATVGRSNPVLVSEIYDNLQEVINQLQEQISKFDRGNGLAIERMALTEFIEGYISRKKSPQFQFLYDKTKHHADKDLPEVFFDEDTNKATFTGEYILRENDPIEYAEFAPEALEIIFDNIVSNACAHGFVNNDEGLNNIIKIDLLSEGDNYVITISNNGSAVNRQISPKDVFTYGKTSKNGKNHYGIGGYEVQRLMREFGGDVDFITNPDAEFPVTYKLTFFKTDIISVEW